MKIGAYHELESALVRTECRTTIDCKWCVRMIARRKWGAQRGYILTAQSSKSTAPVHTGCSCSNANISGFESPTHAEKERKKDWENYTYNESR